MKKTHDVYMQMNDEDILCDGCKHCNCVWTDEPCKSCIITNWQPLKAIENE